jgi:uncharacterized cupredoxin-like copper-binding protein
MRTIRVEMDDALRYRPDRIAVKQGETIRFVVHNAGRLPHEMVIGNEPGGVGEIVWTFTKAGTFSYGCLIPGHWEGGMKGSITVTR